MRDFERFQAEHRIMAGMSRNVPNADQRAALLYRFKVGNW
jgi:hypothetical protein